MTNHIMTYLFVCVRLYAEEYFVNEMKDEGIPEMQRSRLDSCVVQACISVAVVYDCLTVM